MKAIAELQVIPIGSGVSVRTEIDRAVTLLKNRNGFIVEPHASGTNIEGELDEVLEAIGTIHTTLHDEGAVRLVSELKLETRTDKAATLAGKRL